MIHYESVISSFSEFCTPAKVDLKFLQVVITELYPEKLFIGFPKTLQKSD